jgi:hypothetical protein
VGRIRVLRPDVELARPPARPLARRGAVPPGAVLTLVDNSKPRAGELLELLAEELRPRLGIGAVEVVRKPSASRAITPDEARQMAARSHLVISGLGD